VDPHHTQCNDLMGEGSTSAKGTTSVVIISGAEIASAAEPEALEPGAYSEPERRREAPL